MPFRLGPEPIVLGTVKLAAIAPGDRIVVRLEIGWANADLDAWDSGEMEMMLREDGPDGKVVYWNMESCFAKGRSSEQLTFTGTGPEQTYCLVVRSHESRALIIGPYSLQGSVYAP